MDYSKYLSNGSYSSHQKFNYIIGEFIKKLYQIIQDHDKGNYNIKSENSNNEIETNLTEIIDYRKILTETINQQNSNKQCKIFNTTIIQIDELFDSLIDRCIKNKIYYYIKNNIGYTQLKLTFKTYLTNYLNELINGDNYNLNQYFNNINLDDLDNYSDINSILLNKLKNNDIKKISFNKNIKESEESEESESDELDSLPYNTQTINIKNSIIKKNDSNSLSINQKLSIFIKILINQSIKVVEFIDKLTKMCLILYDPNIQYNLNDPYN